MTVVEAPEAAALVESVTSVAMTVKLPAALKLTLNVPVPAAKAASAGKVAEESELVM